MILSAIFWILVISLLIGAGAYVVVMFQHKLKKDMSKEMKMQVSTAVEHYYQLSESK